MRRLITLTALSLLAPVSMGRAQVTARIHIGLPPLRGVVVLGHPVPPPVYVGSPGVIVVRPYRARPGWWRNHRRVAVFYDWRHDRFYDAYRPGFRRMWVYERGGRFYQDQDDWRRRRDDRDGRRDFDRRDDRRRDGDRFRGDRDDRRRDDRGNRRGNR